MENPPTFSVGNTSSRWWFQIFFYFHPDPWGNDPIWRAYFSTRLVQPPTSLQSGSMFPGLLAMFVYPSQLGELSTHHPGSTVSSPCQHHGFHDITASPRTNGLAFDGAEDGSFGSIDLGGAEHSVFFFGGGEDGEENRKVCELCEPTTTSKKKNNKENMIIEWLIDWLMDGFINWWMEGWWLVIHASFCCLSKYLSW